MGNSCSAKGEQHILQNGQLRATVAVFAGPPSEPGSSHEEDPIEILQRKRRQRLQEIMDDDEGHVLVHMNMQVRHLVEMSEAVITCGFCRASFSMFLATRNQCLGITQLKSKGKHSSQMSRTATMNVFAWR